MTDIDKTGSALVAELELEVDQDSLDIVRHARERDQRIGDPNIIDNILIPLWSIIKEEPLSEKNSTGKK